MVVGPAQPPGSEMIGPACKVCLPCIAEPIAKGRLAGGQWAAGCQQQQQSPLAQCFS